MKNLYLSDVFGSYEEFLRRNIREVTRKDKPISFVGFVNNLVYFQLSPVDGIPVDYVERLLCDDAFKNIVSAHFGFCWTVPPTLDSLLLLKGSLL